MKTKKFVQSCTVSNTVNGSKQNTTKRVYATNENIDKKSINGLFNKYYKSQVAALYRAVLDK